MVSLVIVAILIGIQYYFTVALLCISLVTNDETTFSNWKKTEPSYTGNPKEKTEMQEEEHKNVASWKPTGEMAQRESGQENQMMLMWPENSYLDVVPLVPFQWQLVPASRLSPRLQNKSPWYCLLGGTLSSGVWAPAPSSEPLR